jgi:hypothetical protein
VHPILACRVHKALTVPYMAGAVRGWTALAPRQSARRRPAPSTSPSAPWGTSSLPSPPRARTSPTATPSSPTCCRCLPGCLWRAYPCLAQTWCGCSAVLPPPARWCQDMCTGPTAQLAVHGISATFSYVCNHASCVGITPVPNHMACTNPQHTTLDLSSMGTRAVRIPPTLHHLA